LVEIRQVNPPRGSREGAFREVAETELVMA
jgi:hypothetical protein